MRSCWWTSENLLVHSAGRCVTDSTRNSMFSGGDAGNSRDSMSTPCIGIDSSTELARSVIHSPSSGERCRLCVPQQLTWPGAYVQDRIGRIQADRCQQYPVFVKLFQNIVLQCQSGNRQKIGRQKRWSVYRCSSSLSVGRAYRDPGYDWYFRAVCLMGSRLLPGESVPLLQQEKLCSPFDIIRETVSSNLRVFK
jgi:hypothetical protein